MRFSETVKWLVGPRRAATFTSQEVALPEPTKACEQTEGVTPAPGPQYPAFLDQVVPVRLKHGLLQRWSGVKVINKARHEKVPWVASTYGDRPVSTCKTKRR